MSKLFLIDVFIKLQHIVSPSPGGGGGTDRHTTDLITLSMLFT